MQTDAALARLDSLQQRIRAQIDNARALIDGVPAQACPELAKARWGLARMLREYQVFKHSEIFDPAIRYGQPHHVERARRMKERCLRDYAGFRAYLEHWAARDVASEWAQYRPAMLGMSERLTRGLAEERAGVVILFSGSEHIRQLR